MGLAEKKKKSKKSTGSKSAKYIPFRETHDVADVDDEYTRDDELLADAYAKLDKVKKKGKKAKKSKKSKLSIEYSQALDEISDINFDDCKSNLDLLYSLRQVLINTLRTSRGAFNAKPTQGNAVVTARLVSDIQDISKLIENATDYEALANGVVSEVVKPFLERLLLELGQIIQETIDKYGTTEKKKKNLKKYFNDMYRSYGGHIQTKTPGLEDKLIKYILDKV